MENTKQAVRKILVVEDYDDTRYFLKQLLEKKGYQVVEATNGQEAIELAQREHPDLIVMDLDLPILDGIGATQYLRQQTDTKDLPIVAVTEYQMSFTRVKAFAKGCDEYLRKPIDFDELDKVLMRHVTRT